MTIWIMCRCEKADLSNEDQDEKGNFFFSLKSDLGKEGSAYFPFSGPRRLFFPE